MWYFANLSNLDMLIDRRFGLAEKCGHLVLRFLFILYNRIPFCLFVNSILVVF